jgi:outer membrane translocation and assembly module TamA
VARGGAGNVFEDTQDIGFQDLRWGAGIGLYYPSPIGPVSLELGIRDSGKSLVSLVVGWY